MIKKLNFVYDKKSGDIVAPQFVPDHVSALRSYIQMGEKEKDMVYNRFPEDFCLITCSMDKYGDKFELEVLSATDFTDFIKVNDNEN